MHEVVVMGQGVVAQKKKISFHSENRRPGMGIKIFPLNNKNELMKL
jgi:hypothetical protein